MLLFCNFVFSCCIFVRTESFITKPNCSQPFWLSRDLAKENDGHAFANYLPNICTKHKTSQIRNKAGINSLRFRKELESNFDSENIWLLFSFSSRSHVNLSISVAKYSSTSQKHPPSTLPCHIKENCEVKRRMRSPWKVIQVAALACPSSILFDLFSGSPAVVPPNSLAVLFPGASGSYMFVRCLHNMLEGSCEAVVTHCCRPVGYKGVHLAGFCYLKSLITSL